MDMFSLFDLVVVFWYGVLLVSGHSCSCRSGHNKKAATRTAKSTLTMSSASPTHCLVCTLAMVISQ